MGKQSDNTALNIIRKTLGDAQINEVIRKIGMSQTSLSDNETTPYDIGTFFESLWKGNILSEDSKQKILNSLTDTIYEDWIVKGIPEGIKVAHKFGKEINVTNDAGIILSSNPYILVLMGDGIADKEANLVIPEISKKIYEIETGL
jgi:beta-lactamase class A